MIKRAVRVYFVWGLSDEWKRMSYPLIDISGQQFGEWSVIERSPRLNAAGKQNKWVCKCSCGRLAHISSLNLRKGLSTKCLGHKNNSPEGVSRHHYEMYTIWQGIKARCYREDHSCYHRYGGRGIVMSPEWKNNFTAFLRDMGERPDKHSIDRIDNNGPYSKENCRWATDKAQQNNRRNNRLVEFDGLVLTLRQVADRAGVVYLKLYNQHVTQGRPLWEAVERARYLSVKTALESVPILVGPQR